PGQRWERVIPGSLRILYGSVAGNCRTDCLLWHVQQRIARSQFEDTSGSLAISQPAQAVPVLLIRGGRRGQGSCWRGRQDGSLRGCRDGPRVMDIFDAGASRILAGGGRWQGIRGI